MPGGKLSQKKKDYDYGSSENDPAGESGLARQRFYALVDRRRCFEGCNAPPLPTISLDGLERGSHEVL
jgi:hypothetical protein